MQAEVLSQFKIFAFRINHLLKRIEVTNPNIIRKIVQKFEYVEEQKQHLQYDLLLCKIHHLNRCLSMKSYFQWSLAPKAPLEANLQHSGAYSHRTGAAGGSPKWWWVFWKIRRWDGENTWDTFFDDGSFPNSEEAVPDWFGATPTFFWLGIRCLDNLPAKGALPAEQCSNELPCCHVSRRVCCKNSRVTGASAEWTCQEVAIHFSFWNSNWTTQKILCSLLGGQYFHNNQTCFCNQNLWTLL